jgi:hypothetical protein
MREDDLREASDDQSEGDLVLLMRYCVGQYQTSTHISWRAVKQNRPHQMDGAHNTRKKIRTGIRTDGIPSTRHWSQIRLLLHRIDKPSFVVAAIVAVTIADRIQMIQLWC